MQNTDVISTTSFSHIPLKMQLFGFTLSQPLPQIPESDTPSLSMNHEVKIPVQTPSRLKPAIIKTQETKRRVVSASSRAGYISGGKPGIYLKEAEARNESIASLARMLSPKHKRDPIERVNDRWNEFMQTCPDAKPKRISFSETVTCHSILRIEELIEQFDALERDERCSVTSLGPGRPSPRSLSPLPKDFKDAGTSRVDLVDVRPAVVPYHLFSTPHYDHLNELETLLERVSRCDPQPTSPPLSALFDEQPEVDPRAQFHQVRWKSSRDLLTPDRGKDSGCGRGWVKSWGVFMGTMKRVFGSSRRQVVPSDC